MCRSFDALQSGVAASTLSWVVLFVIADAAHRTQGPDRGGLACDRGGDRDGAARAPRRERVRERVRLTQAQSMVVLQPAATSAFEFSGEIQAFQTVRRALFVLMDRLGVSNAQLTEFPRELCEWTQLEV